MALVSAGRSSLLSTPMRETTPFPDRIEDLLAGRGQARRISRIFLTSHRLGVGILGDLRGTFIT